MNLRIQEQLSELNDSFVDQQESLQKVHWTLDEKASLTTFTGVLAITLARLQRSEALRQEQEVTAKASEKETRLLVSSEVKPIFYDLALDCIQYPEVPPTFAPTATDMRPSAGLGNILKKWWTS